MKKLKAILFAAIAVALVVSLVQAQEYPKEYWIIERDRSDAAMEQIKEVYQQWERRKAVAETQLKAIQAREEQGAKKKAVTEGPDPDSGVKASGTE